jgi:tyrosinase
MTELNRRDLLLSASALGLMMATGGCEKILNDIKNRPVRRNIANLASNSDDLKTYRDGVAAMKALPGSDPRCWQKQADIHYNSCPHGNWYFLPWHRCYLLNFERIIQTLTGNKKFGLPYWNWQTSHTIPAPFWVAGSPLLWTPRGANASSVADDTIVGATNIESIMAETNFEVFASYASTALRGGSGGGYGRLEQEPHNYIHGFVGGTMGTYHSPLDPIFWCHHNFIDYMWAAWNMARHNPNTNDPNWANFDLAGMFVDGNGQPTSCRVGITPLMPLLSYQYEDDTIGGSMTGFKSPAKADEDKLKAFLQAGAPVRFRPKTRTVLSQGLSAEAGRPLTLNLRLPEAPLAGTMGATQSERTFLRLKGATAPADESHYLRIFIGNPKADASTPIGDASYAGSIAFFSDPEAMHMSPDFQVDVSRALRARRNQAGAAPTVTLVPVPIDPKRAAAGPPQPIAFEALEMVTAAFDPAEARQ